MLLHEALASAAGFQARFALLDDFFLAAARRRALAGPERHARARAGCARAAAACASRRSPPSSAAAAGTSIAGFREQVGVPPKLLARILRFQRAVALSRHRPRLGRDRHRCGYYDQAHLIRDFHQFAGSSPAEFARRQLPDGGGIVGD